MSEITVKYIKNDVSGTPIYPRTHADAVVMESGKSLSEFLNALLPNLIKVSYRDLASLVKQSELSPGAFYEIVDYAATTTQENTQSANRQFDIIVLALAPNKLSEFAHACLHDGDAYFANSNLNAWSLKYCFSNDSSRFGWADTENGKGVIYYLMDEFGNELPYDFKSIQFKSGETWRYTFDANGADASLNASLKAGDIGVVSNSIAKCVDTNSRQILNSIIFTVNADNTIRTAGNKFGENCKNMKFGDQFYSNTFMNGCYGNTFGDNCSSNRLQSYCNGNAFGDNCSKNSLDDNCSSNTFGDNCQSNTFGNNNNQISLGASSTDNSFGNSCQNISIGSNCVNNAFRNSCIYIAFGNNCWGNTFMNRSRYVKLFFEGTTPCDYVYNCTFDEGVAYFYVIFGSQGTESSVHKNITFNKGLGGTSSSDIIRFYIGAASTPYSPNLKQETNVIAVDSTHIYVRILFDYYSWDKTANEFTTISTMQLT